MMGHVMTSKLPWLAENLAEEELLTADARVRLAADGFLSAATVPLLAEDRALGVLTVLDNHLRRLTEDEVALLMAFADQASLTLEKARLLNEAETERESALHRRRSFPRFGLCRPGVIGPGESATPERGRNGEGKR